MIRVLRATLQRPLPIEPRAAATAPRRRALRGEALYEVAPFVGVATLALALRVIAIDGKPFHSDESEHAWISWLITTGHGYHYDPVFHGPVQFYLMTVLYVLFGASDVVARVAPALVGTVLTALPYFLRRQLGSPAALAAALIFCLSPSYLYFSRFVREDIYAACVTLGLVVAVFRFLERPRAWHPSLILGLLAVSFATKETTYITVFVGGTFFLATAAWEARRARVLGRSGWDAPLIHTIRSVGRDSWLWGGATFLTVYTLLFTTFFTNPRGLQDGVVESVRYWISQQPVNRGNQPWFYYLVVLPGYEWPVLLLGVLGVATVIRRPTRLGAFLIWMFAVSMLVYSWASERMPWLVLHLLLPLVLLAGLGVQALWRNRRTVAGKIGLAAAALGAAFSVYASVSLSYVRPADPKELLVFTQTSTDVPKVRDEILRLAHGVSGSGRPRTTDIDGSDGAAWPWAWYLRDVPAAYPDMSDPGYKPKADVLVVSDLDRPRLAPLLGDYSGRRFRLRVWWVPDWGHASLADSARWLLWRRPWSPKGSFDEWLYVRSGGAPARTP